MGIDQLFPLDFFSVLGLFNLTSQRLLLVQSIGLLTITFVLALADSVSLFLDIDLDVDTVVLFFASVSFLLEGFLLCFQLFKLGLLSQYFLAEF